jgi:hypothetical protein
MRRDRAGHDTKRLPPAAHPGPWTPQSTRHHLLSPLGMTATSTPSRWAVIDSAAANASSRVRCSSPSYVSFLRCLPPPHWSSLRLRRRRRLQPPRGTMASRFRHLETLADPRPGQPGQLPGLLAGRPGCIVGQKLGVWATCRLPASLLIINLRAGTEGYLQRPA